MEFKGTKGQWTKTTSSKGSIMVKGKADENGFGEFSISLGKISDDDCTVPSCCKKTEHANALLISKAPEMLEMLKKVYPLLAERHLYETANKVSKLIKEATEINES